MVGPGSCGLLRATEAYNRVRLNDTESSVTRGALIKSLGPLGTSKMKSKDCIVSVCMAGVSIIGPIAGNLKRPSHRQRSETATP